MSNEPKHREVRDVDGEVIIAAAPSTHRYTYGSARTTHYEGPWRWVEYTPHAGGKPVLEREWCTGPSDDSPRYRGEYHPRCGSCWLGITHTEAHHAREMAPRMVREMEADDNA